ncbi:MAG: CBS domain-containing protein [Anaerolineales bacterium]
MKISNILATKGRTVHTIAPDQSVREAVQRLARNNVGSLVVTNEAGSPVGIITERDVIRHAAKADDVFGLHVQDLMTTELVTGVPQDELAAAAITMTERRFRHLPILDGGKLVGIVSIGDIVKAQRDQYEGEITTLQSQTGK